MHNMREDRFLWKFDEQDNDEQIFSFDMRNFLLNWLLCRFLLRLIKTPGEENTFLQGNQH